MLAVAAARTHASSLVVDRQVLTCMADAVPFEPWLQDLLSEGRTDVR